MPEGPEVWILSEAINLYLKNNKILDLEFVNFYGKHLILHYTDKTIEDWSFGLSGKIRINSDLKLNKLHNGYLPGEIKIINFNHYNNLNSVSWMNDDTNYEIIEKIINKWRNSKKKLGALLLEQSEISGIGVAWGSEILFRADLRPEIKACEQNLDKLSYEILNIKNEIKYIYNNYLINNEDNLINFINNWFDNLYKIRKMNIYKKGKQVLVSGRKWWVKD